MNEFDDTTFLRFARRFARIEQLVPEPPRPAFASMDHRPRRTTLLRFAVLVGAVLLLAAAFAFAAIGSRPSPTVTMAPETVAPTAAVTIPSDSAGPAVVLDAYLRALEAGDCDTARQLVGSSVFYGWHDALCGGVTRVRDHRILDDRLFDSPNSIVFDAVLTTTGTSAGLPPGESSFWFLMQQQSSGAWRIVDGSGGMPLSPSWAPFPPPT